MQQFNILFQEPQTLPLVRSNTHHSHLVPSATAINLRPYRYPYFQKHETEKLIQDILSVGLIRHSVSAFPSPVLLVQKMGMVASFFCVLQSIK